MSVVSNVKNINVMSTSNANLIHNLGSQGKIQHLNELSHQRQFEMYEDNETKSITNCNMSIKTTSQIYNILIKFSLRDNFEIVIEAKQTDHISRTIKKFQESLKHSLNGKLDS